MNRDTIDVRPDEIFDETAVANYLKDKLAGADKTLRVRQFGGGAANLTYLLDYGTHEYVLRRPPLGPVAKSAHDMSREYKVLAVLHEQFPLAPRAFLYCEDTSLIGSDFFVMERRKGTVVRRKVPDHFATVEDAGRKMSAALVDALADFHAVDFEALGLGDLGRPEGFVERQIEGWYKRWHAAKVDDLEDMEAAYQWLRDNVPTTSAATLVHNDYKLDNVMLQEDDPGQMVAIFDWDMCTLGDPLCDLGSLLCYWTEPSDPDHFKQMNMMPVDQVPFMSRKELVERYAEKSGRAVQEINFYHALGLYRLTVIIAQIYIRYKRGQTQDQRFAWFGDRIPMMARAAVEVMRGGSGAVGQ